MPAAGESEAESSSDLEQGRLGQDAEGVSRGDRGHGEAELYRTGSTTRKPRFLVPTSGSYQSRKAGRAARSS